MVLRSEEAIIEAGGARNDPLLEKKVVADQGWYLPQEVPTRLYEAGRRHTESPGEHKLEP
jgi:hypothetical protein